MITYTKLERFIIVGFIDVERPRQWVGTTIHVREGRVGQGNVTSPQGFGTFLLERCRMDQEIQGAIAEDQREKLAKSMRADKNRLLRSKTFQALHQDVQFFGEEAFTSRKKTPK